jgi:hypothetical protein
MCIRPMRRGAIKAMTFLMKSEGGRRNKTRTRRSFFLFYIDSTRQLGYMPQLARKHAVRDDNANTLD